MYPVERDMEVFKGYVKNPNHPECCIVEHYIVEEAVEFCNDYLCDIETVGLPKKSHSIEVEWRGKSECMVLNMDNKRWRKAHLYLLHNTEEVDPYVDEHMNYLRRCKPRKARNELWVRTKHNKAFIDWFCNVILEKFESGVDISENLKWISQYQGMSYTSMEVRKSTFCINDLDGRSATRSSGVTLVSQAMHISSTTDKNPKYKSMSYYGVIEDIWVLIYPDKIQIPMFYCKWVTEDPFILATYAKQIFYVSDPCNNSLSIVMETTSIYEDCDYSTEEVFTKVASPPYEDEGEEVYIRVDHREGIWIHDGTRAKANSFNPSKKRKLNQK